MQLSPNTIYRSLIQGFTGQVYIQIFSGEMPTVGPDFVWAQATYAPQLLTTIIAQVTTTSDLMGLRFNPTPATFSANAVKDGVATWFYVTQGSPGNASIAVRGIMGTLTDNHAANDALLIENVNVVTGSPVIAIEMFINLKP